MLRGFILLCSLVFWLNTCLGSRSLDQSQADSLEQLLNGDLLDSSRTSILSRLGRFYVFRNKSRSMILVQQAIEIAKRNDDAFHLAELHNTLGINHEREGQFDKALENYQLALRVYKQLKDEGGEASGLSNIGVVYFYLEDYDEARKYFLEGLEIRERLGDKLNIAGSLNNLGILFYVAKNYNQALEYYYRSLTINEEIGSPMDIAGCLNNIGVVYEMKGDFSLAIAHYQRSIIMSQENHQPEEVARGYFNIAQVHISQNKEEEAIEFLLKGIPIADTLKARGLLMDLHKHLASAYAGISEYKKAYLNYKKYTEVKDVIFSEDKSKEIGKLEAKYEFEKAEEEMALALQVKREKEDGERSRRDNLQYSGILIFLVLLGGGLLSMGRLSVPVRALEGLVFLTFLLFFEFLLVLLDPYIESYSGGEPAYKLLFNAVLAGMIFPLHALFENTLKSRLSK